MKNQIILYLLERTAEMNKTMSQVKCDEMRRAIEDKSNAMIRLINLLAKMELDS